jgi:hypothetical protein
MIESDLMLPPPELAAYSIDEREIVLPLSQAVAAVDHLERCGRHVVGWEGWLLYPDGRKGHSARHQGTMSLSDLSPSEAAELCRQTMRRDAAQWAQAPETPGASFYFCITVGGASPAGSV